MWNICTKPDNPTILISIEDPVPDGYTVEAVTANPNYLTETTSASTSRHVTVLAFRNRFTTNEKITIEMASLDNPSASTQSRMMSAALRVSSRDLDVATFVDLDRTDTRNGVIQMETYGMIAAGRATIILDSPVLDLERPKD